MMAKTPIHRCICKFTLNNTFLFKTSYLGCVKIDTGLLAKPSSFLVTAQAFMGEFSFRSIIKLS